MAQSLKNRLVGLYEEVNPWKEPVSLDKFVQVAVSKQYQLVRGSFPGLKHCLLGVLLVRAGVVSEEKSYFLYSLSAFNFSQNLVVLFDEVLEDLFKQRHTLVLAQVSEIGQILFEHWRVVLLDANID